MNFFNLIFLSIFFTGPDQSHSLSSEKDLAQLIVEIKQEYSFEKLGEVTLEDLIDSKEALSAQFSFKEVKFGQLQDFGDEIRVSEQLITSALKAFSRKYKDLGEKIRFRIPQEVIIRAASQKLSAENISARLKQEWTKLCSDCRFEIEDLQFSVPKREFNWNIGTVTKVPVRNFAHPLSVSSIEGGAVQTLWVKGKVVILKQAPVAKEDLSVGQKINSENVEWQWVDVESINTKIPASIDLAQSQVSRSILKGSQIRHQYLRRELLVRKGALVVSNLKQDHWQITIPLIAEDNGFLGDSIRLKNATTQVAVTGVVTGSGEVEIR